LATPEHRSQPQFPIAHFHLAAALALLGLLDEARVVAKTGLTLDPGFTIRRYRAGALSDHPNYLAGRERSYEGMRMAGMPEGVMSRMGHKRSLVPQTHRNMALASRCVANAPRGP